MTNQQQTTLVRDCDKDVFNRLAEVRKSENAKDFSYFSCFHYITIIACQTICLRKPFTLRLGLQ